MRSSPCLLVGVVLGVASAPLVLVCQPILAAPTDAENVLQSKGLKNVGDFWLVAEETELKATLDALSRLEPRLNEVQRKIEAIVQQNEFAGAHLNAAQDTATRLKQAAEATPKGSPQRKARDEELQRQNKLIEELKPLYVPPSRFAEMTQVRQIVVEWSALRDEATLMLLAARRAVSALDDAYRTLRTDHVVAEALKALGPSQRLGPARKYNLNKLTKLEANVFSDYVPLHRESGHDRITAILGDELPVTFSFLQSSERSFIPASVAQSLDIEAGDGSSKTTFRSADGRNLTAVAVRLPSLRLGRHVAKEVEVLVLPPEGEDLGAQLSSQAIRDLRLQPQPHLLRLKVQLVGEEPEQQ